MVLPVVGAAAAAGGRLVVQAGAQATKLGAQAVKTGSQSGVRNVKRVTSSRQGNQPNALRYQEQAKPTERDRRITWQNASETNQNEYQPFVRRERKPRLRNRLRSDPNSVVGALVQSATPIGRTRMSRRLLQGKVPTRILPSKNITADRSIVTKENAVAAFVVIRSVYILVYPLQLLLAGLTIVGWQIESSLLAGLFYGSGELLIYIAWTLLMIYNASLVAFACLLYSRAEMACLNTNTKHWLLMLSFAGYLIPIANFFPWTLPWLYHVSKNPE